MNIIKKIPQKDLDDFIEISSNAYPGMNIFTEADKKKLKAQLKRRIKNDSRMHLYGLYKNKKLSGTMILFDFTMNFLSNEILTGGVGFVGVDLLHKKEHICKELIDYFHHCYLEKGACLTALYPFRPDFYKKMGYGYGTKINRYTIKPASLPRGPSKNHMKFLNIKDTKKLLAFYNRIFTRTHGLMKRIEYDFKVIFKNPKMKVVGYEEQNKILGYMIFMFKSLQEDNFILNDIHIMEMLYENPKVLSELLTFLHTQADQISNIVYDTQEDNFHYLPLDPRDGATVMMRPVGHETNRQGLGIMYRVINTQRVFKVLQKHDFNRITCKLKLTVRDGFLKENNASLIVHFTKGRPFIRKQGYDAEIRLDVAEFSSLIMGVIDFRTLYKFGLAEISDTKYLNTVNKLFLTDEKPVCLTSF